MKKLRIATCAIAVLALTACNSIGKEIDEKEAQSMIAEMAKIPANKVINAFTYNYKTTADFEMMGEKYNVVSTNVAKIDKEKLYYYVSEIEKGTNSGEALNDKYEAWVYYKDGYIYKAYSEGEEKSYEKTQKSKAEAEAFMENYFQDFAFDGFSSATTTSIGIEGIEGIGEVLELIGLEQNQLTTTNTYYSNGKNDLTIKTKVATNPNSENKIESESQMTIKDYYVRSINGSSTFDLNVNVLGLVSMSYKGTSTQKATVKKGCKVSYPDLSKFKEDK